MLGVEFLQDADKIDQRSPSRSTLQAATISNSLRATACSSFSRPGRLSRPLAPLMP